MELDRKFKQIVTDLPEESQGAIGRKILGGNFTEWMMDLGAVQASKEGLTRDQQCDPEHFDGGLSFVHAGLTLAASRELRMLDTDPEGVQREVVEHTTPGHFYMGCLAAAKHYVYHGEESGEQLYHSAALGGPVGLVLLFRSRVFQAAFGSSSSAGPRPHSLYYPLLAALNTSLSSGRWKLPTLSECERGMGLLVD